MMAPFLNHRSFSAERAGRTSMRRRHIGSHVGRLLIVAATALTASNESGAAAAESVVRQSVRAQAVPRYGLFELSLRHRGRYENAFVDVPVACVFTAPSGSRRNVQGFYYRGDMWKVRFAPDEIGRWTYSYSMHATGGFHAQGSGVFECLPSELAGPLQRNPDNPYRWLFEDGGRRPSVQPYFAVGLQDCIGIRGSRLAPKWIDGEKRGTPGRRVSLNEYFTVYGQAGFNLFRFSQQNCSYRLYDDLDHYREVEGLATDELLALAHQHGFRVMFGFFGFFDRGKQAGGLSGSWRRFVGGLWDTPDAEITARDRAVLFKEKRFIDYCVARWGVYVDFWELLNERSATDEWTALMAGHVHAVDPARKPVSTSYEMPYVGPIDIDAPHWYESESELDSDRRVQQLATEWKQAGKPVIVGEQGNTGMNWDPLSATRMRIRGWTALFEEISFIFWNTSWSKAGMNDGRSIPNSAANIYLGPEERGYIRVLQDFSSRLDAGVRMAPVATSRAGDVRTYGLVSKQVAAVYLHHAADHATPVRDVKITLDVSDARQSDQRVAEWIDPSTGHKLGCVGVHEARPTLDVPPFTIDLALLVTSQPDDCPPETLHGSTE
jgi:Domain of unknown function (DUF5060)